MTRIREIVAAADQVLRQLDLVAVPHAVALQVFLFECVTRTRSVSPIHSPVENPAQVCGALGEGCGAAIHVDRAVHRSQPFEVPRDRLARDRIDFLPDLQLRGTARDVGAAVRPALPFGQRLNRRVPRRRAQSRRVVHRDADPVTELGIADVVFFLHDRPFAREIDLRERRRTGGKDGQDQRADSPNARGVGHGCPR